MRGVLELRLCTSTDDSKYVEGVACLCAAMGGLCVLGGLLCYAMLCECECVCESGRLAGMVLAKGDAQTTAGLLSVAVFQ